MGFWRIVLTIILPPLGVLLGKGFGWAFILNIILTILGYIRGSFTLFGYRPKTAKHLKAPFEIFSALSNMSGAHAPDRHIRKSRQRLRKRHQ